MVVIEQGTEWKEKLKGILNCNRQSFLIDCSGCLHLFSPGEILNRSLRIHALRISHIYRFFEFLERLPLNKDFRECTTIIIAGCSSLLESGKEQRHMTKINIILRYLEEKYDKMVIIADKEWAANFILRPEGCESYHASLNSNPGEHIQDLAALG